MEATAGAEYLRGEDLQRNGEWSEVTVTISEAVPPGSVKASDGSIINHPILTFEKAQKHLIVGKTNERLIRCQLGAKPSEWIGKKLTLYPVTGNWFGVRNAIAVRVRIAADKPKPFIKATVLGTDITGKRT